MRYFLIALTLACGTGREPPRADAGVDAATAERIRLLTAKFEEMRRRSLLKPPLHGKPDAGTFLTRP